MPTTLPSRFNMAMAADLLAAMSNEKRLLILDIVSREEVSVGRLAAMVDLGQSALSQHPSRLRGTCLVKTRRDAQTIYYKSDSEDVSQVLAVLCGIFPPVTAFATGSRSSTEQPVVAAEPLLI